MRKTRYLFKKTGDVQKTFYKRMGMIKDRNRRDLTEAKGLRGGSKNTQKTIHKRF